MRPAVLLALVAPLVVPAWARAACPDPERPNDPVCEPHATMLRPGATGGIYAPRDRDLGTFVGAGVSLALFDWAVHRDGGGPGVGRITADLAWARALSGAALTSWTWRVGPELSFERNPSRSYVIPYYGLHFGGLAVEDRGHRTFVDGVLGVFLVRTARVIVAADGGWVVPLRDLSTFSGPRGQLSFALGWW